MYGDSTWKGPDYTLQVVQVASPSELRKARELEKLEDAGGVLPVGEPDYLRIPHEVRHSDLPSACWLPHSCDEWVIGGPVQVRALIEDLQLALTWMEEERV